MCRHWAAAQVLQGLRELLDGELPNIASGAERSLQTRTPRRGTTCQMPTVLHIMPERVSAHYDAIMLEACVRFMPGLCRKFLNAADSGQKAWDVGRVPIFEAPKSVLNSAKIPIFEPKMLKLCRAKILKFRTKVE